MENSSVHGDKATLIWLFSYGTQVLLQQIFKKKKSFHMLNLVSICYLIDKGRKINKCTYEQNN